MTEVAAIVPAHDEAARVGATVRALLGTGRMSEVIVVDDGSTDATAERAREAGARVLRLPRNRGKAAAVSCGIGATTAPVVLLCDADLEGSAQVLTALLDVVERGDADMAVAAGGTGDGPSGFGIVERLARWGIERLAGRRTERPLSGQRAVRRDALRSVRLASGFGLEVGLTIDLVRAGRTVSEVPCRFTHAKTGRDAGGFAHRGRQGAAVVRALAARALRRNGGARA